MGAFSMDDNLELAKMALEKKMTLKEAIDQQLDPNTIMAQLQQLQKIDASTDAVLKNMDKTTDQTINQQATAFSQLVKKQLQAKKLQAQQAQQQAQQKVQQMQQAQQQMQQNANGIVKPAITSQTQVNAAQ